MEHDLRSHYLTPEQLQQLAADHRRVIKDDEAKRAAAAQEEVLQLIDLLTELKLSPELLSRLILASESPEQ